MVEGDIEMNDKIVSEKVLSRFWEKVNKKGESECWNWLSAKNISEYGQIEYNGNTIPSHRISWMIHNGEIPKDLYVLHRCNNPKCVNPKHLYIGTQNDNMKQMVNDGRSCYGERHWCSKLNWDTVNKIREEYANDKNVTIHGLSDRYRMSTTAMTYIVLNKQFVDVNYKPVHRSGQNSENARAAKLTWNRVKEIRKRYSEKKSQKYLADEYGVSVSTISYIINNKIWKE